jgi:hypothetical protein
MEEKDLRSLRTSAVDRIPDGLGDATLFASKSFMGQVENLQSALDGSFVDSFALRLSPAHDQVDD